MEKRLLRYRERRPCTRSALSFVAVVTSTVPSQSLESPSGFSISARVNFHFVFWLPKFEILREINADLISGSKHLFLFAGFFLSFFLRGVYRKRMHTKFGITASAPMLSYEKTLKFNMLFSPLIFKLGHLNFNWW